MKKLLIFLTVAFLLTVYLGVVASANGAILHRLEEEAQALENESREAQETLFAETSIKKIEEKAEELSLKEPGEVLYLTPKDVAWRQD